MSKVTSRVSGELTVLNEDPLVAGTPLSTMDSEETPARSFFVRNHFPIPSLDISNWGLSVTGEVERPLRLNYDDLKRLPSKEIGALLECAGNSRATVQPPIEGLLWDHGGVGSARWAGVPLRAVLERAGLLTTAKEVLLEGADHGKERGEAGELSFAMSLPMDKALHPDTLLAYEMNGEALSPEHGYPLRVVVPGWYGMTSVKWLANIKVLDHPFDGFHQTRYYVYVEEGAENGSPKERVTSLQVKSFITWPDRGHLLVAGRHQIRGVAWSGLGPVSKVEVSTDDGRTWLDANLEDSKSPYAWQRWGFSWEADRPGYFLLRARATDREGNVQPAKAQWNYRGFANNSIHAVPVEVRSDR